MDKGKVVRFYFDSKLLKSCPSGDSSQRLISAYLPPGVQPDSSQSTLPVVYLLAPWTSAGRAQFDWKPFRESLTDRLDRLIFEGKMNPAVVVAPDLYTRFGGSQYIDGSFFGDHGSHIVNELVPEIEDRLPVLKGPQNRAVFGRSSGGFGALRLVMDFPGTFSKLACHSGDMGFETTLKSGLLDLVKSLGRFRGGVSEFLEKVFAAPKLSGSEVHNLMLIGLCGFYSPNEESVLGYDLPIDLHSGEIIEPVWRKWVKNDPVDLVKQNVSALSDLQYLYFECGKRDQFDLLYGARQFDKQLKIMGVEHQYEEFDDNHSGTEYRYDLVLGKLSS